MTKNIHEIKDLSISECMADDCQDYWNNFKNWQNKKKNQDDFTGIYSAKNGLPDPDANSERVYEFHGKLWNKQCETWKIPEAHICKRSIWFKLNNETITLSSDSFVSIYWHWKRMENVISEIQQDGNKLKQEIEKLKGRLSKLGVNENLRYFDENSSLYKKFIWYYLQYANTIGGFIVFPQIGNSINVRRVRSPICDRFDLTLECIRKAYCNQDFEKDECNPLFGLSKEDKAFFSMFGSFKNYVDFFCLNSWVTKDYSAVYDLMSKSGNGIIKEWTEEILPCDFKEEKQQVAQWWTFYNNIMSRLEARNEQIRQLLTKP